MNIVISSLVIGPLLLIGGLPAHADTHASSLGAGVIQIAASADATTDKDSFLQKAHEKTAEWRQKLQDLGDKAEAKGKAAGTATEDDVHKAWHKVEAASNRLETASSEEWQDAKAAFETASHEMANTWHKHYPTDK